MQTNSCLAAALGYLKQGISVIPSDPKTKIPLIAWTEYQKLLPTEQEVRAMWQKYPKAMISIVTGSISNVAVVDCDSEDAIKKIEEVLPDSMETTIAVSPRGGRHYYFRCQNGLKTKTAVLEHIDIRANGGVIVAPPSRNISGGQYRWLNCLGFNKEALQDMPESLYAVLNINNNIFNITRTQARTRSNDHTKYKLFEKHHRDNDLFDVARALRIAGKPPEYILQVLKIIALNLGDEFNENKCLEKLNSTFKFGKEEEKSLMDAVREWVLITTDNNSTFLITDVYKDLYLITRDNKMKVATYLSRLAEEGIIERYGEKRGSYRKVNKDIKYMDYVNAVPVTIDIKMPLHLHDVANITPKSIIVIAGSTNAGKTCFMLNVVKMNMQNFSSFNYLNSEMSAERFRERLNKFNEPIEFWHPKLKVVDTTSNFADMIDPNGINFIDYLELNPEKTYMVSKYILDIFNKLDKGIAFVGLQKASNATFGRGGEFNLEKAQLAISIDYNKAKIVKCKSPKSEFSYHNAVIDFSIEFGSRIVEKSGWKQE